MPYRYSLPETKTPRYAVRHWRNTPEERLESLDDFLYWLEYDYWRETDDPQDVNLAQIKELINLYLERDEARIKAGEDELLAQWIKACKGGTK